MGIPIVGGMPRPARRQAYSADSELSVQLHDAATGFAIGLALLKGAMESTSEAGAGHTNKGLEILDDSLARLRGLSLGAGQAKRSSARSPLELELRQEAARLGLDLEFELMGDQAWLAPSQEELLRLVVREALRNVRRHSGAKRCRANLDLSTCPFVLRVRDWGSGLRSGAKADSGIARLQRLAAEMGCRLTIGSQPGLGTELVLAGPPCSCSATKWPAGAPQLVAGEITGRRKDARRRRSVARGRSIADRRWQINQVEAHTLQSEEEDL